MLIAARANSDGPIEAAASNGCPVIQVEGGQRDITIYEGKRVGDGASVIHRAEITKTARECQTTMGLVQVKYGIAGRILLGPKGKPGTVTLPAVMQVFDRARNKVKSDVVTVSVTITRENPLSYLFDCSRRDHSREGRNDTPGLHHFHRLREEGSWRRLERVRKSAKRFSDKTHDKTKT